MNELHRFLFEGLPVRGAIVRIEGAWQEALARRAANTQTGAYPPAVRTLLGEMAAAGLLMQSSVKFNGAVVLQIMGDGPVKLAVVETQADLAMRCTAKVVGAVADDAPLSHMVNVLGNGRCAITLDPQSAMPGQQPYQGVVALHGDSGEKLESLGEILAHYMLQSEQLDTRMILAANDTVAAGLLLQRMPLEGEKNLGEREAQIGLDEEFNRIAILAASVKPEELLQLESLDVLHRLFWEEKLLRHEPDAPRFACRCSRERVGGMLRSLGSAEVESIIAERGHVEVGCDFCGQQYEFDPVDAAQVFTQTAQQAPGTAAVQ